MIYLTYGDSYSGVFSSQVIDVCKHISSTFNIEVKLISFVPKHTYREDKQKIKSAYKNALVYPMLPSRSYVWKPFAIFFKSFLRNKSKHRIIIGRATFAARIALFAKGENQTIIYDGRAAEKAQWEEYISKPISKIVEKLEYQVVNYLDKNIAVSNQLVAYWKDYFDYEKNNSVIIPCTLNSYYTGDFLSEEYIQDKRAQLGYSAEDIVLVFCGSASDWQAVTKLESALGELLDQIESVKILFLSRFNLEDLVIYEKNKDRLKQMWVAPEEVFEIMISGDYGILFRDKSITNKVASPTKFAEYLAAGLKVIISEGIGDYSDLVEKDESLGMTTISLTNLNLKKTLYEDKVKLNKYAQENFSKNSFNEAYRILVKEEIT